jgi:uncharacterized protein (TIGR03086 family)
VDRKERITRATAFAQEKVEQVQPADLSNATPCAEFDLRELLNHMIGNLGLLATAARGDKAERPEGDQFETDPGSAYAERRDVLLSAMGAADVFDRDWELPFGTLAGSLMANVAFVEHLTHGWDVAKASAQDTTLPVDLVDESMEAATAMGDMLRMPGVCGPPVDVPAGASAQDKFIAFMGRIP